ncbi:hypothetical protein PHJA_002399600 [Phtheirospermum japonicum]|uniref:RING-type domain-containing protein n=1 Tax=Phtheirospermum japonicum TaxID=374723 RepID=A0A830D5Y8_9LAMI|nr:hypothetical protein PHJA_002399600 [Phtheirospermum japonicum]
MTPQRCIDRCEQSMHHRTASNRSYSNPLHHGSWGEAPQTTRDGAGLSSLLKRGPFVVWPQGHMGPTQPAGTGPWAHTSPTGELIRAFLLRRRDGTFRSSPNRYRSVRTTGSSYSGRPHRQTAEIVEFLGISPYLSSPVDVSPGQQWTPPAIQEISNDDYGTSSRDVVLRPLYYSPAMEGTSAARNSVGSMSSRSDSSCDYESMIKSHPSHRNRRCFMPKAIHPLSFPPEARTHELGPTTPQIERRTSSSASGGSLDFADPFDHELRSPADRAFRCLLCERLLSQRSPWGPRRIIKTGDMPVSGVLACRHVFHAECLDQTTPKARRSDPPCPVCAKTEEENLNFSKFRNTFARLKPFCEDAPSKPWGCVQAGDCVEGALHGPGRNAFMSLKFRKNLSAKGNNNSTGRELSGKLGKSGSFSPQVFVGSVEQGGAGSSKTMGGSGLK